MNSKHFQHITLLFILAVFTLSCGSDPSINNSNKETEQTTSSKNNKVPEYKQKAIYFAKEVFKANEDNDQARYKEISLEVAEYIATLSNKHRKTFEITYKKQLELFENSEDYLRDIANDTAASTNESRAQKKPSTFIETALGLNMKMIYVEGGSFTMGAEANDNLAKTNEYPAHTVLVDSYYIAEFEITQIQWEKIMGTTIHEQNSKSTSPGLCGVGDNYPIYHISWYEAKEFCEKLSELTGRHYTLPTEAQWEFAARGGNKSQGYKYSGSNVLNDVSWHLHNSSYTAHPVGQKAPNELGIYDMTGNVYEWCADWKGQYPSSKQTNPQGVNSGDHKILRGSSWRFSAKYHRIPNRGSDKPADRFNYNGLRVVCTLD